MAFSCLMNDKRIYSFTYSLKDWISLKEEKSAVFKTSCCGADAILKTSKLGTQFFAHRRKPELHDCSSGGETAEHIHIKYLVSKKLFDCGWQVEVEKRGVSSKGDAWIADVYAEKGNAKIAIEVQWSRQSFIETKRRQQIYADSGVRGAWLLRSGSIKDRDAIVGDYRYSTKSIPVFSVYKNKKSKDNEFLVFNVSSVKAHTSNHLDLLTENPLPLDEFVENLISGNIKFTAKFSPYSTISILTMDQPCWKCKRTTRVVAQLFCSNTRYGFHSKEDSFTACIDGFGESLIGIINKNLAKIHKFKPIRIRYSKTAKSSYMANSCYHCDALMGKSFINPNYWDDYYSDKLDTRGEVKVPRIDEVEWFCGESLGKTFDLDIGKWLLSNNCA